MDVDSRTASPPARPVALFGKIPARPDFVRENMVDPGARELDAWLVRATEDLHAARAELPPRLLRFAFFAPGAQRLMVGALAPSRDEVGREFPVAVFAGLDGAAASRQLAAIPGASRPLLDAADALLREVPALQPEEIRRRLAEMTSAAGGSLEAAATAAAGNLGADRAAEFVQRAFGPHGAEQHYYGFYTWLVATGPLRGEAPTAASTVLQCPISGEADLIAWLELARLTLGWRGAAPSFFWTEAPDPRLWLSLGPPPALLLRHVADPHYQSSKLWPLITDRQAAVERARDTLVPALEGLLDGEPASLHALLARVAGERVG
jgi:type VI secretion system protein ImpM